ncbi:hypothetical protein LP419_21460 [Massilia sp. H-1]|nr:hypothetical protein LP419_21460 [Massilia sp. H-1]
MPTPAASAPNEAPYRPTTKRALIPGPGAAKDLAAPGDQRGRPGQMIEHAVQHDRVEPEALRQRPCFLGFGQCLHHPQRVQRSGRVPQLHGVH